MSAAQSGLQRRALGRAAAASSCVQPAGDLRRAGRHTQAALQRDVQGHAMINRHSGRRRRGVCPSLPMSYASDNSSAAPRSRCTPSTGAIVLQATHTHTSERACKVKPPHCHAPAELSRPLCTVAVGLRAQADAIHPGAASPVEPQPPIAAALVQGSGLPVLNHATSPPPRRAAHSSSRRPWWTRKMARARRRRRASWEGCRRTEDWSTWPRCRLPSGRPPSASC